MVEQAIEVDVGFRGGDVRVPLNDDTQSLPEPSHLFQHCLVTDLNMSNAENA